MLMKLSTVKEHEKRLKEAKKSAAAPGGGKVEAESAAAQISKVHSESNAGYESPWSCVVITRSRCDHDCWWLMHAAHLLGQ